MKHAAKYWEQLSEWLHVSKNLHPVSQAQFIHILIKKQTF